MLFSHRDIKNMLMLLKENDVIDLKKARMEPQKARIEVFIRGREVIEENSQDIKERG